VLKDKGASLTVALMSKKKQLFQRTQLSGKDEFDYG
jgi:hypothetical protein